MIVDKKSNMKQIAYMRFIAVFSHPMCKLWISGAGCPQFSFTKLGGLLVFPQKPLSFSTVVDYCAG